MWGIKKKTRELKPGEWVVTWTGGVGRVRYVRPDGWIGVRLFGERCVHEWQPTQVTVLQ